MKALWLLRHAEAAWPRLETDDSERELTADGQLAAARQGVRLQAACSHFDQVLCSPAQRTRATARQALRGFAPAPPLRMDPRIYEASLLQLLAVVAEQPAHCKTLLLIGHNPGLSELAGYLCAEAVVALAPADVLGLSFAADSWAEVVAHKALAAPLELRA